MEAKTQPSKIALDQVESAKIELLVKTYSHIKAGLEILLGTRPSQLRKYRESAKKIESETLETLGFIGKRDKQ